MKKYSRVFILTSLSVALFFAVMACGGSSEADVEATVEAKVQERRDADIAVEATAEAMAVAIVEATAQAQPTPTSTPTPTPTSTPIPTPTPTPTQILRNALEAMGGLESYKYEMAMTMSMSMEDGEMEIPFDVSGYFRAPDSETQSVSFSMLGFDITQNHIKIADQYYFQDFMSDWTMTSVYDGFDVADFWSDSEDSFFTLGLPVEAVVQEITGAHDGTVVDVYVMKVDTSDSGIDLTTLLTFFGEDSGDVPDEFMVELWVEVETGYLRKFVMQAEMSGDLMGLGLTETGDSDVTSKVSIDVDVYAFNENLPVITAPEILEPSSSVVQQPVGDEFVEEVEIGPLKQYSSPPEMTIDPEGSYTAVFEMQNGSEFIVELYPKEAPITVNSFVFLARDGYYDGVTFHRVIPDFMAQGGDPTGTGGGGPGYSFENEFSPIRRHDSPGILSMANRGLVNGEATNGSQFFIMYTNDSPRLDGMKADGTPKDCSRESCHSVFGKVIEGMDVVNDLSNGDVIKSVLIKE